MELNNSFSTKTNAIFGSDKLREIWLEAQSFQIPSITLNTPKIGGRHGTQLGLSGDTATFSNLIIDVIVDNNFNIYNVIYKHFLNNLNIEKTSFKNEKFDTWLEIKKGNGTSVKKFNFYGCRLEEIGEVNIDFTDDADEVNVITLSFSIDYMDFN